MIISDAFKNDTLSKNTQLIPLVIIEKFISEEMGTPDDPGEITYKRVLLSTHNIQLESSIDNWDNVIDNYFKPLLLNVPKISQNIDISDGKFQVSSVTLNISNIDYNNSKRLSEELESYNLINSIVCIHYKSQSCTKIQMPNQNGNGVVEEDTDIETGCPRIFTGVIRNIKHTKDKITLSLEDITEKTMNKDLPISRLGSGDNVPDKYKNSYIPMLYGRVENAPTVASYQDGTYTFKADSEPIFKINSDELAFEGVENGWVYNSIKIYSDGYVPLTTYAQVEFVKEDEHTQENPYYEIVPVPDDEAGSNRKQFDTNDDNSLSFRTSSMFNLVNRVEVLYIGNPKTVLLTGNYGVSINGDYPGTDDALGGEFVQHDENTYQYIDDLEYGIITDNEFDTSINENQISDYYFSNIGAYDSFSHRLVGLFSLQWDSGIDGAKYVRVINNKINNIKIPVKGDANKPEDFGIWDNAWGVIYIHDIHELLTRADSGFNAGGLVFNPSAVSLENLISYGDGNTNYWQHISGMDNDQLSYNEDAPFKVTTSFDPDGNLHGVDVVPILRLADGNNAYPQCADGWSSLEFFADTIAAYVDGTASGGEIAVNIDLDIEEIDVTCLANFDDVKEKNYYLNAEGRTDIFLFEYEHLWTFEGHDFIFTNSNEYLTNPTDIIRNILVKACNIKQTQFDENEFNIAWLSRSAEDFAWYNTAIKLGFSINEEIEAKKVLQNIYTSSRIFPRFKNNGKLGFITTKYKYDSDDYYPATEIDPTDIISYTFGLTPSTDLISKIDVSYDNDYEQGKLLKTTDSMQMDYSELKFYNINKVEDNYLNVKAEYITDKTSADNLRDLIWYDRKAQHLEIELILSLSYINLETGDLVKFPLNKLIDDITAHGINYSIPTNYGGAVRYPLFQVINVTRNLENVKIKLHQLHYLGYAGAGVQHILNDWHEIINLDEEDLIDIVYADAVVDEEFDPIVPTPQVEMFKIGYDSAFTIGGVDFPSSYYRYMLIGSAEGLTEATSGGETYCTFTEFETENWGADSNMEKIFSAGLFGGINEWEDLIPAKNSDDSGYGSILNGSGADEVGGFVAMQLKFELTQLDKKYVIQLQNIKDTIFDYDPDSDEHWYTNMGQVYNVTPSTTEIKLGLLIYDADDDWQPWRLWSHFLGISVIYHHSAWFYPYISASNDPVYETLFKFVLYPYYIPETFEELTLEYSNDLTTHILPEAFFESRTPVNQLDVTDVVQLYQHIENNEEYAEKQDMNSDEVINVLDVVLMVNMILGND